LATAWLYAPAARAAGVPEPPPARLFLDARARPRALAYVKHEAGRLPLGAGALAGVNFDTDRGQVAEELGFREVAPNSIDAVSGRELHSSTT